MMKIRRLVCYVGLTSAAVAMLSGCSSPEIARVQSIEGAQTRTLPLSFVSLDGRRDSDRVSAALEFRDPHNRDRLLIQLRIDLGPPIRLAGGNYRFQLNDRTLTGTVESSSLDFQAGQSGGMGLGGTFLLLDDTARKVYRVDLPQTVIGVTYR